MNQFKRFLVKMFKHKWIITLALMVLAFLFVIIGIAEALYGHRVDNALDLITIGIVIGFVLLVFHGIIILKDL